MRRLRFAAATFGGDFEYGGDDAGIASAPAQMTREHVANV
jgi:hypothetical protein